MLILIIFSWFFLSCIGTLVAADLIVRLEYSLHRENWEADGRPYGNVWLPPKTKKGFWYAFGNFSLQYCSWKWLLSTPDWMRGDEKALRLVFWLRTFSLMSIMAFLALGTIILTAKSK
jgi:hypothetical protein